MSFASWLTPVALSVITLFGPLAASAQSYSVRPLPADFIGFDVNESGSVLGECNFKGPCVYAQGTLVSLLGPRAANALHINNKGEIIGEFAQNDQTYGLYWKSRDAAPVVSSSPVNLYGINDNGVIIGQQYITNASGSRYLPIFSDRALQNFRSLEALGFPYNGVATSINNNNKIAGYGSIGGRDRTFIFDLGTHQTNLFNSDSDPSRSFFPRSIGSTNLLAGAVWNRTINRTNAFKSAGNQLIEVSFPGSTLSFYNAINASGVAVGGVVLPPAGTHAIVMKGQNIVDLTATVPLANGAIYEANDINDKGTILVSITGTNNGVMSALLFETNGGR